MPLFYARKLTSNGRLVTVSRNRNVSAAVAAQARDVTASNRVPVPPERINELREDRDSARDSATNAFSNVDLVVCLGSCTLMIAVLIVLAVSSFRGPNSQFELMRIVVYTCFRTMFT
jgi:hypothetical protein